MIKIYDINDKLLMQVEVTSAAKREQEMSKSDYISLSFSAAEKVILPVGAYINYTYKIDKVREVTRKFLLLESYEPNQIDECSWKYTPQFQHPKMILSKTPFFIYTRNSQNVEVKQNVWSFVGTTSVLSDKIADFLNKDLMFGECGWKVIFQNVTANTVNVSFSDNDFISALTAITNAIGDNCEWHIDYDDEIIYIGKVFVGATPFILEVGKNVGVPNISNSRESYYNAFSIFGGTRNITQVNSKGENISSGDIRLQLDEGNGTISIDGKERSYSIDKYSTLDLRADKTKEPLFTKVLDFSQIFPSLNTYVYNVRGRVKYVLDKNKEKIPISYNADGSVKEYKTFTVWYMRLAYPTIEKIAGKKIINTTIDDSITHYWYDFEITDDLLIKGKNIGCSFEANTNTDALSTPLAGRGTNGNYVGFELTYHKDASSSHSSDDVSANNFSILAGDYEIIYQEDNEVIIPTNAADMLIPRGESMPSYKCNITVLYNIAMAKSIYTKDAQKRLLVDALKEIKRLLSDLKNYTVKSYPQVFEANNPCLQIGQNVVYDDGNGYQLHTHVRKISTNIDFEFVQEITIGNEVIKGNTAQLREDVQTIIASGGSIGNGGGYSVSQLRNLIAKYGIDNFLSKQFDDTAEGKITFIKGLVSKGRADLKMGAKFGNNATITQLGEAVLSAIKSLDYDNAAEQGFSVEKEKNGKYHAFVTNLTIWGKAIFHELEVRKLSYSGGNIYLSGAGSKLIKVVPVKQSVSNGVTTWVKTTENDVECVGWKCYLLADNGTTATMNDWQEGDQARCQTMGEIVAGGAYSDVSNKSYWRTIPDGGVSTQNEKIYGTKTETYLDEDGNEQTKEVQVELYDGQAFAWIVVGKHCDDIDGYDDEFSVGYNGSNPAPLETRDIPAEGDTIVLDGNRHRNEHGEYDKTDRQNVIILETTGEYAPRIACYANITEYKHTFVKSVNGENKEVSLSVFETSPKGGTKINSSRFEWISDDGSTINIINYRGDWVSGNKYHKNDQVNHNNAVWVCVANSGVDVSEEPSDGSSNWKKVLSGGKGEKGDDAVSYSVQFSIVNDTVNGVTSQRLYVTFTKSVGSNITSGTIGKIGFNGRAKVYLDGEENGVMSSELSRDYPYIDIGDKGHADTIKGKKNLSVELIDANGKIVASNTFFFAEKGDKGDEGLSGEGVVMAYKNAPSRPAPPTTKDPSLLSDGWSRTPQKGGSYEKVSNVSYGNYTVGATGSGYSTSEWSEVSDGGYTWRKSPAGLSDNHGWALMKVSFTTNVDNADVKVIIKAYSEANFDFIQVHELDKEITGSISLRKTGVIYKSGNGVEDTYNFTSVGAGQHFFYVSYCKDTSGHGNGDYGLFRLDLSENLVSMPSTVWMSQAVLKEGKAVLPWSTPIQITGDDAVSYNINFVTHKDDIHNDTLLYVYIVRSVGKESTSIPISNIPQTSEFIGIKAEVYCDGVYNENLTNYVKSSGYIQRSAWKTVKNFEVRLYTDGELVASNSYSFGEQGTDGEDAYRVVVSPSALIFDTDDNGRVTSFSGKTATIRVYQGDKDVSKQFSKYDRFPSNYYNCNGSLKDLNTSPLEIQVAEIETQVVTDTEGNESTISKTNGFLEFILTNDSATVTAHVDVQVNVAKFTGQMVNTNKRFSNTLTEVSNRVDDKVGSSELTQFKAEITQTAREISLSVSEKTIGRRNLLVGSAFRRQGEVSYIVDSHPYFIRMNDGYGGTNCAYMSKSGMTQNVWCGAMWNPVTVKPNTKYTFSMMLKVMSVCDERFDVQFIDVTSNSSNTVAFDTLAAADKMETFGWTLKKITITTPSLCTKLRIDAFIRRNGTAYMCRPMLEEGDYNGWTLSQEDYDYVGGNLLDNARTLDKSGTLIDTNDTVIQNGYGTDSACIKNLMKANATPSDYKEVLRWSFGSTYLVNGNDYIFSFVAKADVDDARVVCCMWSGDIENSCNIFTEGNGGAWDSKGDGNIVFILSRQWTRYWVHWRPKDGYATPKEVIIRHTGNNITSASTVYVTQPKLEIGATMTEWTERKTDLVDKASLKAAGIEITSEKVKLYGDQIEFAQTKSGTAFAMFKDGMLDARLINAAKIIAERLETSGNTGQRVAIEDGLMQIFGTNGVCNIKFGVNDNGEAILSYYDKNGKWLYDLGPNKLDGSQITSSAVTIKEYVKATIKPGTNDFYDNVTYLGKGVKQVKFQYSQLLFGNNRFMNEDDEIKKNSSAHIGYQPFANESNVTKLYRYSAPRMGNTIVKDDKYGLSTADLAKRADGKYFTSMTMASGGSLVNLAPVGVYFGKNEAVRYAPYPNASVGSTNDRFPAFTIGGLEISKAGVGSSIGAYNGFYSYLTRKVTNLNTDIIS